MGMFDRIMATCRACGSALEFQSKSGDCNLDDYTLTDAPMTVAVGALGDRETCPNCQRVWRFVIRGYADIEAEAPTEPPAPRQAASRPR